MKKLWFQNDERLEPIATVEGCPKKLRERCDGRLHVKFENLWDWSDRVKYEFGNINKQRKIRTYKEILRST
jgi:hypothetical protein